jgi:hypothetical protein
MKQSLGGHLGSQHIDAFGTLSSIEHWPYHANVSIVMDLKESNADLNSDHQGKTRPARKVKVHNTKDLLTIFSDPITVKFIGKDGTAEVLTGRWCLICKYSKCMLSI